METAYDFAKERLKDFTEFPTAAKIIKLMQDYAELHHENQMFLMCCGSCSNFISFMAESGFCKIAECNCVCKNPKAMIDMFDKKCDKWKDAESVARASREKINEA